MTNLPREEQPIFVESAIQGDLDRLEKLDSPVSETPDAAAAVAPHINPGDRAKLSDAPPEVAAPRDRRALSLDGLRGFFLVLMTFGFTINSSSLPLWMYHRQAPNLEDTFVDIAGLTWRDLAYASFLFTMAAALPLTLSRRMEKGERDIEILIAILRRGFMLFLFALLVAHSNTFFTGYTDEARGLALVGFALMAMIFTRRRPDWSPRKYRVINLIGWVGALVFLALSPLAYGKGVSLERADDIIVGLAFASVTGSIIWYLTRENINARLAALAVAVAFYLGAKGDGWVGNFWWADNVPSILQPSKFVLLTVVIPGTIAGDLLLRWMKTSDERHGTPVYWSNARIGGLAFVCAMLTPIVVVGLYNRWVIETTEIVLGFVIGGAVLAWNPRTEGEKVVQKLFAWSALWLLVGLVLEPFEGGIHKTPDTLSYYFTVMGLAGMLLVSFFGVVDLMRRRRIAATLIDVGHNPLLCYVLFSVFLTSLLELISPLRGVLEASPWQSILRSIIETALVVLIVRWMSRRKIFWRT